MRIESFWARGYRSLRDVRIGPLGAFSVFYGPNGSGKSNILAALEAWLRLIPIALETRGMRPQFEGLSPQGALERMRGELALHEAGAPLRADDFAVHAPGRLLTLGGTLADGADIKRVEIELQIDASAKPTLRRTLVAVDGVVLERDARSENEDLATEVERRIVEPRGAALRSVQWEHKFSLVRADRASRAAPGGERPPEHVEPLSWYFRRGQLKDGLFAAHNATSPETVRALDRFRQFMAGPPLHRPPFRAVEDAHTGVRDLREWLPPPLDAHDISLDLAGLGIAQVYWILAQAMLSGARAVGIEEPEAHLHAPTTGRDLRVLLKRLVDEHHLDQLFIATHSNLFDLDPDGYWDVSMVDGETRVERKPLHEIDARHLYEPGPAKHALAQLLRYAPDDEVVFRRPDGAPVTAKEMLRLLQEDDDTAVAFLHNLHGAALRIVRLDARRQESSA